MRAMITSGVLVASSVVFGCGGSTTRTPDQWQAEFHANIERKMPDIRGCYENLARSGELKGKVDSEVEITFVNASKGSHITFINSSAPAGVQGKLYSCVKDVVAKFEFDPDDTHQGKARWRFSFDPDRMATGGTLPATPATSALPSGS